MAMVWQRLDCTGGELILALALADIAGDDGERIYPSLAYLCSKTRQSENTVRRQLKKFRKAHWLQMKKPATGGRSLTNRYRINPEWVKGANLAGFPDIKPYQMTTKRVPNDDVKGAIAMAPDPLVSIKDPKRRARAIPKGSHPPEPKPEIKPRPPGNPITEDPRWRFASRAERLELEAQQQKKV